MTTIYGTHGAPITVYDTTGRLIWGPATGAPDTPPVDPPVDPATLTTLRQVANNSTWWRNASTAGPTGHTVITKHTIQAPANRLRIRQGVHGWAGADAGLSGRGGLVINDTYHRVTWGGEEKYTIPRLQHRTSDPLPDTVIVKPGDVVYSVFESDPGTPYVTGSHGTGGAIAQARQAGPYAGPPAPTGQGLAGGALGLYGTTTTAAKAILCMGDSILESGWMHRAADAAGVAWSDLSQWAEGIPGEGLAARLDATDPQLFTLGLTEYATNNRSLTPQAVAGRLLVHWRSMVAGPVKALGQTTMVPYVAGVSAGGSTSLSTLDGQVATDKEWRDTLNGWLRDGAPLIDGTPALTGGTGAVRAGSTSHPLIGICDIAAATEATNSRGELVWRVDKGQATSDGVHPTRTGANLMEPVAAQWFRDHI